MKSDDTEVAELISRALTSSLIRFSVVAFIALVCTWAFLPFLPIMLWAIVLAIALYPVRLFIESKLGWSPSGSATAIAVVGVLILGIPSVMIGNSFTSKTLGTYQSYQAGTLVIPAPPEDVAKLPVVGEDIYASWGEAAEDLPRFVETRQPSLKKVASWFVEAASGAAKSVFLLIGAIVIAGIMLAWAEEADKAMRRIFTSFSDDTRGPELYDLSTKTIRQVAVGIIGIAFITAMTLGGVMALAGVPAVALLTLLALLLAVMQIPVTLVALVAVGLLWNGNDASTVHNTIFSVLMIAASLIDNFLKPLILGRGLDVPMPVVLMGALGGMMSGGILGMFIGAVFLTAGYQVFSYWVDAGSSAEQKTSKTIEDR
ncbi:MAG: AI-2E family transporter [Halioglobus sp.]